MDDLLDDTSLSSIQPSSAASLAKIVDYLRAHGRTRSVHSRDFEAIIKGPLDSELRAFLQQHTKVFVDEFGGYQYKSEIPEVIDRFDAI